MNLNGLCGSALCSKVLGSLLLSLNPIVGRRQKGGDSLLCILVNHRVITAYPVHQNQVLNMAVASHCPHGRTPQGRSQSTEMSRWPHLVLINFTTQWDRELILLSKSNFRTFRIPRLFLSIMHPLLLPVALHRKLIIVRSLFASFASVSSSRSSGSLFFSDLCCRAGTISVDHPVCLSEWCHHSPECLPVKAIKILARMTVKA